MGCIVLNRCPHSYNPTFEDEEPEEQNQGQRDIERIQIEEGDHIFVTKFEPEKPEDTYWRKAKERMEAQAMGTQSQKLAEKALQEKGGAFLDGLIPKYLDDFTPVFKKASFNHLLECHQWDHAIELKPEVEPFNSKIYPLSLREQAKLNKFIEEHL